ncbi:MAG: nitroreductase family protein [Thermogutta sp.]
MDVLTAIMTRRSIRAFDERPVPEELRERLLQAAMAAPSARNAQPWQFVVIDHRATLMEIAARFPNAQPARTAPLGILVCGDLSLELSKGYWVIDCAAAAQNILLAAHGLGLGALWTGVYPRENRVEGLRDMFDIPEHVVPHSLILVGYAAESPGPVDRFDTKRIHHNRW